MLTQFIICFAVLCITFLIAIFIKMGVHMYRFMIQSNSIIELYKFYKPLLKRKFNAKEGNSITITYKKMQIEFSSSKEASEKFEKLINEALYNFEKLGAPALHDPDLKDTRDKLLQIGAEIRTLRWQNEDF